MSRRAWLTGVLAANGLNESDVQKALGMPEGELNRLVQDEEADKAAWNQVLSFLNDLPSLSYPAADILEDLDDCIRNSGAQVGCTVYYGVNASDLIFTGFRDVVTDRYYGSNSSSPALKSLHLTLQEAWDLFFKRNCTLQS